MKHLAHITLLALLLFAGFTVHAQQSGAALSAQQVISKITTNPATGYEDNFKKLGSPYDGSAKVYVNQQYADQVKSVTYQTYNIAEQYRHRTTVAVKNGMAAIPNLRENIYEIISVEMTDGTVINGRNYQFNVFTASFEQIPFGPDLTRYTANMEGDHVKLFKENYKKFTERLAEMKSIDKGVGLQEVVNSLNGTGNANRPPVTLAEGCDAATNWTFSTYIADEFHANNQIYWYVSKFKNLCNCEPLFYCYSHNGTNGSDVNYVRVSGSVSGCDLIIRPVNGNGQSMHIVCGQVSCPGTVPPPCTPPTLSKSDYAGCTPAGTVTVTNRQAGYTYSMGGQVSASGVWTGVAAGTQTVVASGPNCSATAQITIYNSGGTAPAPQVSVTHPGCGQTKGTFNVTNLSAYTTGGNAFPFWSVDGGTFYSSNNGVINAAVAPGSHTVSVKVGTTGCIATSSFYINPAPTVTYPSLGKIDPSCTDPKGTVRLNNYQAGQTYSLDGGTFTYTSSWANLASGYHTVTAKNASGCTTSAGITLAAAPAASPLPFMNLNATSVCLNGTVGFTVGISNGTSTNTYLYIWEYSSDNGSTWTEWYRGNSNNTWAAPSSPTLNKTGLWKFRLTTSNGCGSNTATTGSVTVTSATTPTISATHPTCTLSTGSISVTAPVAGYTYSLDGQAYTTATSWSGLAANTTHTVKAKNTNGCESSAATLSISPAPTALAGAVTSNQTPCSVDSTTLTASGGTTYSWRINSATGTVVSTKAIFKVRPDVVTTYFVVINNGTCSDTKSVVLSAPRPTLTLVNIVDLCKGNSTVVQADNGGVAGYTYRWLDNNSTNPVRTVAPVATTKYAVERTSTAGCKDTAAAIVNVFEQPVISTVVKVDASCSGANDGSITITASSVAGLAMEYSINGNTWSANPAFINLAPGAYSVLVRNKNGICQATSGSSVVIGRQAGPSSDFTGPDRRCADEFVQFNTTANLTNATYSWTVTNNGNSTSAPVVSNGKYNDPNFLVKFAANNPITSSRVETITVTVSLNGCSSTTSKNITVSPAIFAVAPPDTSVCKGGQLSIGYPEGVGGPIGASYEWSPADKISGNNKASKMITAPLTSDQEFTLTVTDPINGCSRSQTIWVVVNTAKNPTANAGPDKILAANAGATMGIAQSGAPTSQPDASSFVSYNWVRTNAAAVTLDDATSDQPFFTMPGNATPDSVYNYVLEVRKQYKSTSSTPGLVCKATDTVVITVPLVANITLSGNLWNNGNGDDAVDSPSEIYTNANETIYAILTDAANNVVGTQLIPANGTYTFTNVKGNTAGYTVIVSATAPAGTSFSPAQATTPANWVYIGSQSGTNNSSTFKGAGFVKINTGTSNVTGVNIGFDRLPTPQGGTVAEQTNPGGTTSIPVASTLFSGKDPEDAPADKTIHTIPADKVRFTDFPSNASSITINGTAYTPAAWLLLTEAQKTFSYSNLSVSVDPLEEGKTTVEIPYTVIDQAGQSSATVDKIVLPFVVPDLLNRIFITPTVINGTTSGTIVVRLSELNNAATSGQIQVYFTKHSKVAMTFNPTATVLGGLPVQNSVWTLDDSDPAFFILTTNAKITAGGRLAFGFNTVVTPGNDAGIISLTSTIYPGSGGETDFTNNTDAGEINLFIKK